MRVFKAIGPISTEEFASYIDHTQLKPQATVQQLEKTCLEAKEHSFAACCISSWFVKKAAKLLKGTKVKVDTVIGFPLGNMPTNVKLYDSREALENGAEELDMVMNIGALKSGLLDFVKQDISSVAQLCREKNAILKVILETPLLTEEEKALAAKIAEEAGADFVKTCTGFESRRATVHDVKLLRASVSDRVGVKAAGGIRYVEDALAMISAGANRIGTSSGVAIIEGFKRTKHARSC